MPPNRDEKLSFLLTYSLVDSFLMMFSIFSYDVLFVSKCSILLQTIKIPHCTLNIPFKEPSANKKGAPRQVTCALEAGNLI